MSSSLLPAAAASATPASAPSRKPSLPSQTRRPSSTSASSAVPSVAVDSSDAYDPVAEMDKSCTGDVDISSPSLHALALTPSATPSPDALNAISPKVLSSAPAAPLSSSFASSSPVSYSSLHQQPKAPTIPHPPAESAPLVKRPSNAGTKQAPKTATTAATAAVEKPERTSSVSKPSTSSDNSKARKASLPSPISSSISPLAPSLPPSPVASLSDLDNMIQGGDDVDISPSSNPKNACAPSASASSALPAPIVLPNTDGTVSVDSDCNSPSVSPPTSAAAASAAVPVPLYTPPTLDKKQSASSSPQTPTSPVMESKNGKGKNVVGDDDGEARQVCDLYKAIENRCPVASNKDSGDVVISVTDNIRNGAAVTPGVLETLEITVLPALMPENFNDSGKGKKHQVKPSLFTVHDDEEENQDEDEDEFSSHRGVNLASMFQQSGSAPPSSSTSTSPATSAVEKPRPKKEEDADDDLVKGGADIDLSASAAVDPSTDAAHLASRPPPLLPKADLPEVSDADDELKRGKKKSDNEADHGDNTGDLDEASSPSSSKSLLDVLSEETIDAPPFVPLEEEILVSPITPAPSVDSELDNLPSSSASASYSPSSLQQHGAEHSDESSSSARAPPALSAGSTMAAFLEKEAAADAADSADNSGDVNLAAPAAIRPSVAPLASASTSTSSSTSTSIEAPKLPPASLPVFQPVVAVAVSVAAVAVAAPRANKTLEPVEETDEFLQEPTEPTELEADEAAESLPASSVTPAATIPVAPAARQSSYPATRVTDDDTSGPDVDVSSSSSFGAPPSTKPASAPVITLRQADLPVYQEEEEEEEKAHLVVVDDDDGAKDEDVVVVRNSSSNDDGDLSSTPSVPSTASPLASSTLSASHNHGDGDGILSASAARKGASLATVPTSPTCPAAPGPTSESSALPSQAFASAAAIPPVRAPAPAPTLASASIPVSLRRSPSVFPPSSPSPSSAASSDLKLLSSLPFSTRKSLDHTKQWAREAQAALQQTGTTLPTTPATLTSPVTAPTPAFVPLASTPVGRSSSSFEATPDLVAALQERQLEAHALARTMLNESSKQLEALIRRDRALEASAAVAGIENILDGLRSQAKRNGYPTPRPSSSSSSIPSSFLLSSSSNVAVGSRAALATRRASLSRGGGGRSGTIPTDPRFLTTQSTTGLRNLMKESVGSSPVELLPYALHAANKFTGDTLTEDDGEGGKGNRLPGAPVPSVAAMSEVDMARASHGDKLQVYETVLSKLKEKEKQMLEELNQ